LKIKIKNKINKIYKIYKNTILIKNIIKKYTLGSPSPLIFVFTVYYGHGYLLNYNNATTPRQKIDPLFRAV
jgi:hypothetical protein